MVIRDEMSERWKEDQFKVFIPLVIIGGVLGAVGGVVGGNLYFDQFNALASRLTALTTLLGVAVAHVIAWCCRPLDLYNLIPSLIGSFVIGGIGSLIGFLFGALGLWLWADAFIMPMTVLTDLSTLIGAIAGVRFFLFAFESMMTH